MGHRDRSRLPPLKYWRARTVTERYEAARSGLLPGLLMVPVVLIAVAALGSVVRDPPMWFLCVTTLLVIAPFGFWAELRSARKRQERDARPD
jgi:hypothetical protein